MILTTILVRSLGTSVDTSQLRQVVKTERTGSQKLLLAST